MNNKYKIRHLKIAFWIAAITDGVAAIIMIFPELREIVFGAENFSITTEYRYALGMGGALMSGWTVLLIWASLKPIERKGILIITLFPVITGIIIAQIFAVTSGYIDVNRMIPVWIHLTVISSYFIFAYVKSKK